MDLIKLAKIMHSVVARTGQPASHRLRDGFFVRLRSGPGGRLQLMTIKRHRQPSLAERDELRAAFGIPLDAAQEFDYRDGWGIMKLTWQPEQPTQPSLPGTENESNAGYYRL